MTQYYTCRFFDGKQLQPINVQVEVTAYGITILPSDNENPVHWTANQLQLMEPAFENRPAVIGSKSMLGARLIITDKDLYQQILAIIPKSNIKHSGVQHPWRKIGILVCSTILLILGLLWIIPKAAPTVARMIPESWDDKLGQYLINDLAKKHDECVDPKGIQALQKLTNKITSSLKLEKPLDIKVIQMGKENINAFAVPGNHIVIFSSLLDFADTPDEVAGVLAHEIGHATEHHPTQGLIRKVGIDLILTGAFGSSADYATTILHLKYSRNDEQQADDIAIKLLNESNIDTKGFVNFFEKLAQEHNILSEHEEILQYFSDHPGLMERVQYIQSKTKNTKHEPSLSAQDWQALKGICQKTAPLEFK
jgi:Zn-dependent protease with chaperone function